jgi:hypothetical protein
MENEQEGNAEQPHPDYSNDSSSAHAGNANPRAQDSSAEHQKWYMKPLRYTEKITFKHLMEGLAFVLACIVAAIYYGQLEIMRRQLSEMEGSSMQSTQLIAVTAHQANATNQLALAAKTQANQSVIAANAANIQASALAGQFDIQKQTSKLIYGANLQPHNSTDLYDLAPGKAMWVWIRVNNNGKSAARTPFIAANLALRDSIPRRDRDYKRADFLRVQRALPPDTRGRVNLEDIDSLDVGKQGVLEYHTVTPISASAYSAYRDGATRLYVWGFISYKDVAGPDGEIFCRWVSYKEVPAAHGRDSGGYNGPWYDCYQSTTQ